MWPSSFTERVKGGERRTSRVTRRKRRETVIEIKKGRDWSTAIRKHKDSEMWRALDGRPAEISMLTHRLDLHCGRARHASCRCSSRGVCTRHLVFNLNLTRFAIFSLIPRVSPRMWGLTPEERSSPLVTLQICLLRALVQLRADLYCPARGKRFVGGTPRHVSLSNCKKHPSGVDVSRAASVRSSLSVRQTELWIQDSQFLL